ncbi:hypothetical protein [Microvirga tunisiensis]|uniref:Uncharacterized protein n=1 Tax=Microvirga tunisiensis TaxID=2108360 RepID=A0A5N7MT03_9HYPH|nr:hypothetical protein [Microvirga tunisiensis]MPR12186.1 hypothetical protein [Microvirga tunisiensis]MPR30132.1 hypothetical protein [Microvirga tunisiensis]
MPAPLIWTDRISAGCSEETYFGGRFPGEWIIIVARTWREGIQGWGVSWNCGSHPRRVPAVPFHADFDSAIAHAEQEVASRFEGTIMNAPFEVTIAAIDFHGDVARPDECRVTGTIMGIAPAPTNSRGEVLQPGNQVTIFMSKMANANRTIADLIKGSQEPRIAKCRAGSVVRFHFCDLVNDSEIAAGHFVVDVA